MESNIVKIQVEWEWLEANIMPDLDNPEELEYYQAQFDPDALREYAQYILASFLDEPDPDYFSYWDKALQPTAEHFKSFKSYFEENGFKFTDEYAYHKLFFLSLILWRNFAYNGTENSGKSSHELYQIAYEFHTKKMGHDDGKKKHRKLLVEKRKGLN